MIGHNCYCFDKNPKGFLNILLDKPASSRLLLVDHLTPRPLQPSPFNLDFLINEGCYFIVSGAYFCCVSLSEDNICPAVLVKGLG